MLVSFKDIKHDFYGNIEHPVLTLKRPDGRIICTIGNYYGLKPTFRYNDVSEVEFIVPAHHDGVPNNGYDEIIGTRLIEIEPFGDFVLINPEENNDGIKQEKFCKAYSLEYQINNKRAEIPPGTYCFYNPVDNKDTLVTIIKEFLPDWSFGTIDRELIGKWRTFDTIDENLYTFMMNTLQKTFNCLFLFDTKNKKINVKSASTSAHNLPIYLSYENLVKNIKVTELTEEIVTALSAYGSGDSVNISAVNPNGTATIYNLDYYIDNGDLPPALAEKWQAYKEHLALYQQVYSNLNILYKQKYNALIPTEAKLTQLDTELSALMIVYDEIRTEKSSRIVVKSATDPSKAWETDELKQQHKDELWYNTDEKKPYKWDGDQWTGLTDEDYQELVTKKYDEEIAKVESDIEAKEAEIESQKVQVELLTEDKNAAKKQLDDIAKTCKLTSYFTTQEIVTLSPYLKHDSFTDSNFVVTEYAAATTQSKSNIIRADNKAYMKVYGSETYASNIAQIYAPDENGNYTDTAVDSETGETKVNSGMADLFGQGDLNNEIKDAVITQLNEDTKRKTYDVRGGNLEFIFTTTEKVNGVETQVENKIAGNIVNVNFHYNTEDLANADKMELAKQGAFLVSAVLRNATIDGASYPSLNLSLQGSLKVGTDGTPETPVVGEHEINFDIETATFYTSAASNEFQQQTVIQELYDYAVETLNKLSKPSYEFSVDSANFIFAQEFEPFKDQLELGCTINLEMNPDTNDVLQPICIELQLNYDDETSFAIAFSNKFQSSNSEFKLADIITETARSSHSLDLQKADYIAYKDSKTGNQVNNMMNSMLDVAVNAITNSTNQSVSMDSRGFFLRKTLADGSFDPKQVGMINRMIAFTDDSWQTVKVGIGYFDDPNLGDIWGIVAPHIVGTLIIGENLIIQNTVTNPDGTQVVKEFKVDSTGAWLNNASFVLTKEPVGEKPGAQIVLDPKYGLAMGTHEMFTLDKGSTEIKPSFIDSEDNIIWDEEKYVAVEDEEGNPTGEKNYYRPKNTQFYFDINTGDAYFGGTINAERVVAETLHGKAIKDNTVETKKVIGLPDILKELDERVQSYSQTEDPSKSWTPDSDGTFKSHIGDLWFNPDNGLTKRWNGTGWDPVTDSNLEQLAKSKVQIFTEKPTTPYAENDVLVPLKTFIEGGYEFLAMKMYVAMQASDIFNPSHWTELSYTGDEELTDFIENTYNVQLEELEYQVDGKADTYYQENTPAEHLTYTNIVKDTDEYKKYHNFDGDMWYKPSTGETWMYQEIDNGNGTFNYQWEYMNIPEVVFDELDSKRQIFVRVPDKYMEGDLWVLDDADCTKEGDKYVRTINGTKYEAKSTLIAILPDGVTERTSYVDTDWFDVSTHEGQVALDNSVQALDLLGDIASDSKITPSEKQQLKLLFNNLTSDYNQIVARADKYKVARATLDARYNTLKSMVQNTILANMTTTIDVPSNYASNFSLYYAEKENVEAKIEDATKQAITDAEQRAKDYAASLDTTLQTTLEGAYKQYIAGEMVTYDNKVAQYLGAGGKAVIDPDGKYVISPYLGGGYLNITGDRYRVIIDPQNKTKTGNLFQVYDLTQQTALIGFDTNGAGYFKGTIYADAGEFTGAIKATSIELIGDGTKIPYDKITNTPDLSGYATTTSVNTINQQIAQWCHTNDRTLIDGAKIYTGTITALGAVTAGSFNLGNGTFTVSPQGVLSATGATISGTLTSIEGSIGGFTIKNGYLYNGSIQSFTGTYTDIEVNEETGETTGTGTDGVYIGTDGIRMGATFKIYPSGTMIAGKRIYLPSGRGLRGMRAGYTDADWNNSNALIWINNTDVSDASWKYAKHSFVDRVIVGNPANNAPTELRSPSAIFFKCHGAISDKAARTLIFSYAVNADNNYQGNEAFFMPGDTELTNLGGTNFRWKNVYAKNGDFTGNMSISGITTINARIQPNKDINVNLGTESLRWLNVYCQSSTMVTSDLQAKKNISDISDKYIALFDELRPCTYQFIDGTSGRIHTGFIAQEVELAMEKVGLDSTDLAFFCKDKKKNPLYDENDQWIGDEEVYDSLGSPEYIYALRYEEYIAILTEKIKRLEFNYNNQIRALQSEIADLKQQL